MAYYAAPVYVGLSCLLSLSYSCMECARNKGKIDNTTKSLLCGWVIVSGIVASVVAGVAGEMMVGLTNVTHILVALILVCVTLSISSSIIYWS
jgi:hypothetical protein